MPSFSRKFFLSLSILFLTSLLFFFNNCAGGSGNGEGYDGINIDSPNTMKRGETITVTVSGGSPPYKLTASSGEVTITNTSTEGEFKVTVPSTFSGSDFSLQAEDALGETASKSITVDTIEISGMSYIHRMGGQIINFGLNDKIAVLNAIDYLNETYGTTISGLFSFSHQNNVIEKFAEPLLNWDDLRRVGHGKMALDNQHLILGNALHSVDGRNGVGSVTIYTVTDTGFVLSDFIVSPSKQEQGYFGRELSLYKDTFVVGSPSNPFSEDRTNRGTVYIYRLENGVPTLVKSLLPPDESYINFGAHTKIQGDFLYIGSWEINPDMTRSEKPETVVHTYKRKDADWVYQGSLNLEVEARKLGFSSGIVGCNGIEAYGDVLIASCQHIVVNENTGTALRNHMSIIFKWENGKPIYIQTITSEKPKIYNNLDWLFSWPVAAHENLFATEVIDLSTSATVFHIYKWNPDTNKYSFYKRIPLDEIDSPPIRHRIEIFGNKLLATGDDFYRAVSFLVSF